MRKLALLILACAPTLYGQFTPDDTTRVSYSFLNFTRTGERKIEARDVYLDSFGVKGKPIKRQLLVIFDGVTGYFLLVYEGLGGMEEMVELNNQPIPSTEQRAKRRPVVYVSERGVLKITIGPSTLGIRESNRKATSLDDAERQAIRVLNENVLEVARLPVWPAAKNMPLMRDGKTLLDSDFYAPPMSAVAGPIRVVGIAESTEGWEITLKGQYKARVTLSPSFQPLKAERIVLPLQ